MLGNELMPEIHLTGIGLPQLIMQDGTPPHYILPVYHISQALDKEKMTSGIGTSVSRSQTTGYFLLLLWLDKGVSVLREEQWAMTS
jgi:hypothetical protein